MNLLEKYNVPGPRYTSYPTVPFWNNQPTVASWQQNLVASYDEKDGMSLYLHLPFCETFCTYCACNKLITKNHSLEDQYIKAILKEWDMYRTLFKQAPLVKQLHLGGGTPIFFSAQNLELLVSTILNDVQVDPDAELSVELHPNMVSKDQIEVFQRLGFNRFSLGIQDFDLKVQTAINRFQTKEKVQEVLSWIKAIPQASINFDLIYGLPFQNLDTIKHTFDSVINFNPDRISFYSYAHVPWKKNAQRKFTEKDLPEGSEKMALYEAGKQLLIQAGYEVIGMDHFALPSDELNVAMKEGRLNRNFMGYTVSKSSTLVGLGVSSISETNGMYVQNEKNIRQYYDLIDKGVLPIVNGHALSKDDQLIKQHVMNLICQFETSWQVESEESRILKQYANKRAEMVNDKLVIETANSLVISPIGRSFVRNICMTLDPYLLNADPDKKMFSQTV